MKMLKLCPEFSLPDMISKQKELKSLLKNASTTVIEILNSSCFTESFSTRRIKTLDWPQGVHYIQFRSKNCIAIKEVIEKFIEMEYKE